MGVLYAYNILLCEYECVRYVALSYSEMKLLVVDQIDVDYRINEPEFWIIYTNRKFEP